jgi:MFS family permease
MPVPLSREARIVLSTTLVNSLGNGLVLPFLLIYLHEVRGIPLAVVGLVLATPGAVGLVGAPAVGTFIDRFGARRVLIGGLLTAAAGNVLLTGVQTAWEAFGAVVVVGLGGATAWPAGMALLSGVTTSEQRARVFAIQFTLINAGIGLGGVAGGLLADVHRPGTFALLYALNAVTFTLVAAPLFVLRQIGNRVPHPAGDDTGGDRAGWRVVLRDRTMRRYCVLAMIVVGAGYAQLESGFPAYATGHAHVSTRVVGFAFSANCVVIVLGQMLVLKRLEGRRRTRAMAGFAVFMAAAWVLLAGSALVGRTVAAVLVVAAAMVFAGGETLWSPSGSALVQDLAPPHLRGRYTALSSLMWQAGSMLGPVLSGVLLGAGLTGVYFGLLLAGCAVAVTLALRLETRLTPRQNGLPDAELAVTEPVPPTAVTA